MSLRSLRNPMREVRRGEGEREGSAWGQLYIYILLFYPLEYALSYPSFILINKCYVCLHHYVHPIHLQASM
jgi:hypothetical protein